jgi:hypothetical protein
MRMQLLMMSLVIRLSQGKGSDATVKKDKEITLSKCAAYGPVNTPASQGEN